MDFNKIEELNNKQILDLYNNIIQDIEPIAQYMTGYVNCTNGRRGYSTSTGYGKSCGSDRWYTVGNYNFNDIRNEGFTDRNIMYRICQQTGTYGYLYIRSCSD